MTILFFKMERNSTNQIRFVFEKIIFFHNVPPLLKVLFKYNNLKDKIIDVFH